MLTEGMYKVSNCNKNFMNYGYWEENTHTLNDASIKLFEKLLFKHKKGVLNAKQILDIGCGRGMQDVILTKYTTADITAIDICPNNIIECNLLAEKNKLQDNITFIEADACKLPFKNESFDVIISLESAFHYPSREIFLKEVYRVLRPGGSFLLGDIIINKKSFIIYYLQKFICNQLNVQYIYDKDLEHLHKNLDKHNFTYEIENITNSTFIPFYTNFIKNYHNDNMFFYLFSLFTVKNLLYLQKYTGIFSYIIASCIKPNHINVN